MVDKQTKANNTIGSLVVALDDWLKKEYLKSLFNKTRKKPLEFSQEAITLRELNRKMK